MLEHATMAMALAAQEAWWEHQHLRLPARLDADVHIGLPADEDHRPSGTRP
jgi:hypothetical protein